MFRLDVIERQEKDFPTFDPESAASLATAWTFRRTKGMVLTFSSPLRSSPTSCTRPTKKSKNPSTPNPRTAYSCTVFPPDVVSPRDGRSINCGLALYILSICATGMRPDCNDLVRVFLTDPILPPYYSPRPLPDIFAFAISTAALLFLLPVPAARRWGRYYLPGNQLLTFAAVVILLGFPSIQLVYAWRIF